MSDLKEAVARAIDPDAWADDVPIPTRDGVLAFHDRRQQSCERATAALTTIFDHLMEPSEGMEGAGDDVMIYHPDDFIRNQAGRVWQAMLTKAKEEAGL